MKTAEPLSPALEDYLVAILILGRDRSGVRSRDVARFLGVHKSTVTAMLKTLAAKKLVRYTRYEPVALTALGRRLAVDVESRYLAVEGFLVGVLRLDSASAAEAAGDIAHVISPAIARSLQDVTRSLTRERGTAPAPTRPDAPARAEHVTK